MTDPGLDPPPAVAYVFAESQGKKQIAG